jgi:carbamoyl-phosphate synthase small subunit
VSTPQSYEWAANSGSWALQEPRASDLHVVAVDYGIKRNILNCLVEMGCKVTVVPSSASASDVLAHEPDGVFLSNGPGDPAAVTHGVQMVRDLLGRRPLFGICLGHQLLSLALGGSTYKLKFGHRGLNQPVQDLATGRIEVTTQNHGFCVDVDSLKGKCELTHLHLNDGTCEGIRHTETGAFSVQYHPEASAGPHDARYLFERFVNCMRAG